MTADQRADDRRGGLLELLLHFRNVVLWLNGHIHGNRITARPGPAGGHGFWEVTTSSLVDWPCQARLVGLFHAGDGFLGLGGPMIHHHGAALARLPRELAGNAPLHGFGSWRART